MMFQSARQAAYAWQRAARRLCLPGFLLLAAANSHADSAPAEQVELGRLLYFDTNLSLTRTQSCASCHDPAHAFADPRPDAVAGAVSLGADGRTLGRRNAPSIAYVMQVPDFTLGADGQASGGFFLDGRARDLATQAVGPVLNPREMAMPDAAAVAARLRENPDYVARFGAATLADPARALAAVGTALAAFEQSEFFAPFDSRYDRYLRGEYRLTPDEEIGRRLFFSSLLNCASCHLLNTLTPTAREPFSNFQYHNIGVPANDALNAARGQPADSVDRGLAENPAMTSGDAAGRFRVPTLRNITLTAPYMHNGVFRDLSTALHFYNRHLVDSAASRTNPETGAAWGPPEVATNLAHDLLRQGQPLDEERIATLIAFLRTLTDQRYEALQDSLPTAP